MRSPTGRVAAALFAAAPAVAVASPRPAAAHPIAARNVPLQDATPFEAEVAVSGGDAPAITIRRQVYRGTGLAVVIVENMPGHVQTFEMEGSFARSFRDGRGLVTFAWNRPMDRYAWDQPPSEFEAKAEGPKGSAVVRSSVKMFPDEEIAVGSCRLPVKHGLLLERGSARTTEFWFSPDLRTNLRRIVTTGTSGVPRTVTSEVKSLTIEGVPPRP